MCIKHTPTSDAAAQERDAGARKAEMSFTMQAPAATAAAITSGLLVSMEIAISDAAAIPSITGSTRAISTAAVTRTLLEADTSRKRRDEVVDKMAAAYILQGALDRLANLRSS